MSPEEREAFRRNNVILSREDEKDMDGFSDVAFILLLTGIVAVLVITVAYVVETVFHGASL